MTDTDRLYGRYLMRLLARLCRERGWQVTEQLALIHLGLFDLKPRVLPGPQKGDLKCPTD
jgi:hypothetical protein